MDFFFTFYPALYILFVQPIHFGIFYGSFFSTQIRVEAAYLYDAVHLYAKGLITVLKAGGSWRNGTAIIEAIKGSKYRSAMG